jgi:tetratricopeptide (TPR) repeat protein
MSVTVSNDEREKLEEGAPGGEVSFQQLPVERAEFFFLRARRLYRMGGKHSVILERVVTTTLKAMSFATENIDHYLFLSRVYLKAFDLSSSLFCLRYAIKINPKDNVAKKKIGEVLFLKGQEILCEALRNKGNRYLMNIHVYIYIMYIHVYIYIYNIYTNV